jgi:hypothetical protein
MDTVKLLLAAILFTALATSASAQNVFGHRAPGGGGTLVDLDSRLVASSGHIRVWVVTVFKDPVDENRADGLIGRLSKAYFELDCVERRRRVLQGAIYTKDDELVVRYLDEAGPWSYIMPDTLGWGIFELVCTDIRSGADAYEGLTLTQAATAMIVVDDVMAGRR